MYSDRNYFHNNRNGNEKKRMVRAKYHLTDKEWGLAEVLMVILLLF